MAVAAAAVIVVACQRAEAPWEAEAASTATRAAVDSTARHATTAQPTLTVDDAWAAVNRYDY